MKFKFLGYWVFVGPPNFHPSIRPDDFLWSSVRRIHLGVEVEPEPETRISA